MGKQRKKISNRVLRTLLARSGNQCAYTGCTHPIFNEHDQYVAELAHIEAYLPGGPRYNPLQSVEERNGIGNLMFLCHRHHIETDDTVRWPTLRLQKMKAAHDARFRESPFQVNTTQFSTFQKEMDKFWAETKKLHEEEHLGSDLKMDIDFSAPYSQLADEIKDSLQRLYSLIAGCIPKEKHLEYFDLFCLGMPNHESKILLNLQQMELMYLQEYLKSNEATPALLKRLEELKAQFKADAQSVGHAD